MPPLFDARVPSLFGRKTPFRRRHLETRAKARRLGGGTGPSPSQCQVDRGGGGQCSGTATRQGEMCYNIRSPASTLPGQSQVTAHPLQSSIDHSAPSQTHDIQKPPSRDVMRCGGCGATERPSESPVSAPGTRATSQPAWNTEQHEIRISRASWRNGFKFRPGTRHTISEKPVTN